MEIPGYEGFYYIEPNGDVYSQDRIDATGQFREGQKINPDVNHNGYYYVGLSKHGTRKHFLVHRLLAIVYIPNPFNYPCVNHIDFNRKNNNLNNLEWCSQMYNTQSINSSRNFGTIYLTESNTYQTKYRSNGNTYSKTFKTEKEAKDYLNQVEQMLIKNK